MFLIYLTLFVLLSISAFIVFTQSRDIIKQYNETLETSTVKLGLLLQIQKNAEQVKSTVLAYVVHSDPVVNAEQEKSVYDNLVFAKGCWILFQHKVDGKEEQLLLDSLHIYEQKQSETWLKVIQAKKLLARNLINENTLHVLLLNPAYPQYQNYISKLSDFDVKNIHSEGENTYKLAVSSGWRVMFLIFFSYCLLITLGILIWKALRKLQGDNYLLLEQQKLISQQKKLFEGILTAAPDGIIGLNGEGAVILFNRQAESMFGYYGDEIINLPASSLFSFPLAGFAGGPPAHLLNNSENELYGIRKNQTMFPIDISIGDINTEKGICLILIVRDVTIRKKAEEQLREKNSILKKLTGYLRKVREDERMNLARDVHDELGQLATALKINIDYFKIRLSDHEPSKTRVSHAITTIDLLINTIRKIASGLRPSVLDHFGLNTALKWQCSEFEKQNAIPCAFEGDLEDIDLAMNIKTELFRITQESLTNIMRHADAQQVTISIQETEDSVKLTITDNGIGFDTSQITTNLGLVGLRERALSISAELTITSEAGKGTTISVIVPKTIAGE